MTVGQDLYCGLDLGTTNFKVVLCDGTGRIRGEAACPTPRETDDRGAYGDPSQMLRAVETLLESAWRESDVEGRIATIAAAGTGEDGFLVDADLTPLEGAIPWYDLRATSEARELAEQCNVTERSGIAFEPTRTAAKWLWLSRNVPRRDDGLWIALTDWPSVAWTGMPAMSETLATRTACWDLGARDWIGAALAAAEAPALPPVVSTGGVMGTLLPDSFPVRIGAADTETRVVAAGHDHPTAAAAIRAAHPGAIVDSLGTAELIHGEAPEDLGRLDGLVRSIPGTPGMRDACLYVLDLESVFEMAGASDQDHDEIDAALNDPASQLHHRMVGATMVAAEVLERMARAGVPDGMVLATGGRSRSDALMQLRADVMGRTIGRMEDGELCGLGAAIIGASGLGLTIVPELRRTRFDPDGRSAERHGEMRRTRREEINSLLVRGLR